MQSQKLAFDRARAARKARSSAWPSFDKDPAYKSNIPSSFNPFDNKFGSSQFKYSGAKDSFAQDSLEDWQKAYEDDEHDFALAEQEKDHKLQYDTSKIAKEAQEEAQKRAQGQQRRRGVLGLVSSAASFIPGVGPLISAGINAFS
jgi:hypothetical protein